MIPEQDMAKRRTTRNIEPLTRRASFVPETFDQEARTVELVWTTGARVLRRTWMGGEFYEELSLEDDHVRLGRLNNGAPLLNAHNGWDLSGIIGVTESARLESGKEGRAVVRFPKAEDDEDADRIFRKVGDGIIRNVSVGYSVYRWEITEEEGKPPVARATDWEPFELSLVPMGADADAAVRAKGADFNPCEFIRLEERTIMAKTKTPGTDPQGGAPAPAATVEPAEPAEQRTAAPAPAAPQPAPAPAPAVDEAVIERERAEAARAERKRCSEIRSICADLGLREEDADKMITDEVPLDEARTRALDLYRKARKSAPAEQIDGRHIVVGEDRGRVGAVEGLRNALLHRGDPAANELDDAGRQYRAMSLLEMARHFLEAHGRKTRGLSKHQLAAMALGLDMRAGGMHSTDDFPLILADVAGKTLRRAYDDQPQTFRAWCRRATLPDFKEVKRTQLGDAPQLVEVPEGAEFTRGSMGEAREVYSLITYGRVFAITRQTLINDDLDAFTRMPMLFGRRAADLESDVVYDHLTANPTMGDGTALFHADHGNTGTGAIGIDPVSDGRAAMRKQTGIDGKRINVMAKYLLVPAALETAADQMVSQNLLANQIGNVNVFAGKLTPIAEPRLDDASETEWYLTADPAAIDTVEYGYLEGEEGVAIEQRVGFDVDGVEIKARLDFGAKAIDWRGLYQSSGV